MAEREGFCKLLGLTAGSQTSHTPSGRGGQAVEMLEPRSHLPARCDCCVHTHRGATGVQDSRLLSSWHVSRLPCVSSSNKKK